VIGGSSRYISSVRLHNAPPFSWTTLLAQTPVARKDNAMAYPSKS
jgi:hypothetical protein